MHELVAIDSKSSIFMCNLVTCGKLFNLYDAIGHSVSNQYKVQDDDSNIRLGRKLDYEDMQKVSVRKAGRRF